MGAFDPISHEEYVKIADSMVGTIKMICPRFSLPEDEDKRRDLVAVWASALKSGPNYPRSVYRESVNVFARYASRDDEPPMPGDILRYCRMAAEEMETDPVNGPKLQAWRDAYRMARSEGRI